MQKQIASLYQRNRFYISDEEQQQIKNYKIVLGGAGIGSIIAECALRLGFEHICIIDGDVVEESNLNRQNYKFNDIGKHKTEQLTNRLTTINPKASISFHSEFISSENIERFSLNKYNVAINALDFASDVPFLFDKVCTNSNIPVIHPYNFGWAACAFVVDKQSMKLDEIQNQHADFELALTMHVVNYLEKKGNDKWLRKTFMKYIEGNNQNLPFPQLSVASWYAAAMSTTILFNIATNKPVKTFPDIYYSTILE